MAEKVTIVTALLGDYDSLRVPVSQVGLEVEWVCITDQRAALPAPWQPVRISRPVNRRAVSRFWKTAGLPRMTSGWCIWIDANVEVISPFFCLKALTVARRTGVATWRHPSRTCVYEEAFTCLQEGKDKPEHILSQVARYRQAGYAPQQGLYSTQCVVWDFTREPVRHLADAWWGECRAGSLRDQISLPYVEHCAGVNVETFPLRLDQGLNRPRRVIRVWRSRWGDKKRLGPRCILGKGVGRRVMSGRKSSGLKYLNEWVAIHPHR